MGVSTSTALHNEHLEPRPIIVLLLLSQVATLAALMLQICPIHMTGVEGWCSGIQVRRRIYQSTLLLGLSWGGTLMCVPGDVYFIRSIPMSKALIVPQHTG
jgi:hypothetical protein